MITSVAPEQLPLLAEHLARHYRESGRGEHHFMPFPPSELGGGPRPLVAERFERPLTEHGWRRAFAACLSDGRTFVAHVDLKGDEIRSGLHRCELGIGIERAYRGAGLGRRLMRHAIDFASAAPSLAWLDLRVFGHNAPARALYRALGFEEIGTVQDRFRIEGTVIDDVLMTLDVQRP